jgi:hypothetical protein
MKRLTQASLIVLALATACRGDDADNKAGAAAEPCAEGSLLAAYTAGVAGPQGAIVHGHAFAPEGVTVRAVYVADVRVSRAEFNYRVWSVEMPPVTLLALARDGFASVPVRAYTSLGCTELPPDSRPRIDISDLEAAAGGSQGGGEGGAGNGEGGAAGPGSDGGNAGGGGAATGASGGGGAGEDLGGGGAGGDSGESGGPG